MELLNVIIILLLVVGAWCLLMKSNYVKEDLSGFGVTSGLHFNNRLAYCDEGNEHLGGAYAGGCFIPHRVIV